MGWNLNTNLAKALLKQQPAFTNTVNASTISFGDGDGLGSTDTINDTGNGLAIYDVGSFILVGNGANKNSYVQALTVTAGKIEVEAGSFSAEVAGNPILITDIQAGALAQIMENSVLDLRSSIRPSTADMAVSGTLLLTVTKNGGAFVAGEATNGLSLGEFSGQTLKRGIDPATGATEIWQGDGVAGGTAGHGVWWSNDRATYRADGAVATSGADINMANGTTIGVGVTSEVTDVIWNIAGN